MLTNTQKFMENTEDIIDKLAERYGDVEVYPDANYDDKTITMPIKTLTECSDPSVNYYEDGLDSIYDFIEILKEKLQIKSCDFTEDVDVGGNEWECWVSQHGYLTVTI